MERVRKYRDFSTGELVEIVVPDSPAPESEAPPAQQLQPREEERGFKPPPEYFEELKALLSRRKDPWKHISQD
jgi:hypothetical protein